MPDYKELYYKLFRANEKAIRALIRAQQQCEELILSQDEDEGEQDNVFHLFSTEQNGR